MKRKLNLEKSAVEFMIFWNLLMLIDNFTRNFVEVIIMIFFNFFLDNLLSLVI